MRLLAVMRVTLIPREGIEETRGKAPKTSKPIGTTLGPPTSLGSFPTFSGQFQCVLQTTRAPQNVGIIWMTVPLTTHFNAAESVGVVHVCFTLPLYIHSIPAFVLTLDHLWDKSMAAG